MKPDQNVRVKPRRRLTRRAFLLSAGGLVATGGLGTLYARYCEPFWPAVQRQKMDFPGLDPVLDGLRLMQLSDLHVSSHVLADFLHQQFQHCCTLSPDLIVITGDFVTAGHLHMSRRLAELLRLLKAPLGVFAVLGNHDYGVYSPARRPRGSGLANRVVRLLTDNGVTVLRNEMRAVAIGEARLQLVGLEDLWGGFHDPEAAFADVDPDLPCIALAHNPDAIDDLKHKPCHWILSGHTHGGQVRIPLFGAPFVPIRNRQYDAGLFNVAGQRLYVNRGLGYLRPLRFNCRPEITLFTLTRQG